jgi:alpha 1,2-mannosyltransferase
MNRGIIILAGGMTYFLNAYANCVMLRELGCTLPIEWFYLGKEMKPEWLEKVQKIDNVKLIDLGGEIRDNSKGNGGWQNKVVSILSSSFDEALYLDADCFPIKDPSYLFDHTFFQESDCVLYPDPFHWVKWKKDYLDKTYNIEMPLRQVESGQMMFHLNKAKCREGLEYCRKLNENHEEVYKVCYGDKDTFLIGMLQAKANVKIVSKVPGLAPPVGMLHYDFDGKPLFVHLAGGKWRKHGRPFVTQRAYPHVNRVSSIIRELQPIL